MKNILIGMAVGDALGVPYEFIGKKEIRENPCIDMIGHGVHNQPIGTWSDDSSMAFCMLESLIEGWDLRDMGNKYLNWYRNGWWTPHGEVFDMGFTTQKAMLKLEKRVLPPNCCGDIGLHSNGNGSVMRILPIVPYFIHNKIELSSIRYKMISDLSSITHGHQLSVMSCFALTEFARHIWLGRTIGNKINVKTQALMKMQLEINSIKDVIHFNPELFSKMHLIFNSQLADADDCIIKGDGFCVSTVEASIWCILTTDNYRDAVLKAVNLGDDTDTTACVTGGLAGMLYGIEGIPTEWKDNLVRKTSILDLANRYEQSRG